MKYTLLFLSCLLMPFGASAAPSNAQLSTYQKPDTTIVDVAPITPPVRDFEIQDSLVSGGIVQQIPSDFESALTTNLCTSMTCAKGQTCVDGCCKFQ